ncbi:MAG TPA: C4-type zinc ribbon domain-containing protein [Nitrospiria bacterium]|nr:C4-type zinc ribbon domain-containing protein [Nitrospiria bacterium]
MNEQLEFLIRLQEIDHRRTLFREAQEGLPQKIEAAQKGLKAAQERRDQVRSDLDHLGKERKEKERELQSAEEKQAKMKGRLTELKTNKEYQAHLAEIESAKTETGKIEEDLLILMERGDSLKKNLVAEENRVAEEERRFLAERTNLETQIAELQKQAEGLQGEEADLLKRISPKLLQEYKQLISTRKGLAVVPLQHSTCSGCHFSLPPQLVTEVRKREKTLTCSYCHRILFWPKE